MQQSKQQGYSLIELLIAVGLGLLVLTAVAAMLLSMVHSDADNLKAVRLSQEMRAALSLMSRDIRRSGGSAVSGPTTMAVFSNINAISTSTASPSTSITFFYDADWDGALDAATETFGYRHDNANQTIEMLNNGATWSDITDSNVINVTSLWFTQTCVNESGVFMRQINIILNGRLADDTTVRRRMTESVKIRNDYNTAACP